MELVSTTRRWSMLAISLIATLCANVFINGVAFLIPALQAQHGVGLPEGGLLASLPNFGMVLTLLPWGYLLDRVGERIVLTVGLALTAAAAWAAASVHSMMAVGICLFLGGMAAASSLTAGGRLVTGWFPSHQRAFAMGIRQTAQPLGIAVGALVIPELGKRNFGVALLFPAAICAVSAAACALGVHDPPRPTLTAADHQQLANPYRGTAVLWRIHAASALLMVPQPVVLTFMLVWFMEKHGLSMAWAAALVGAGQLLGALARAVAGRWSDRVGSRMRPLQVIAGATALTMMMLALTDQLGWPLAVAMMVVASAITGDNGLPFTTVPEFAGPFWSGRALGAQNVVERLTVAIGPPVFGALITAAGYPLAFAVSGLFPLAALPFLPIRASARVMSSATATP
ncbi:MAG: MFS transporter [Mycobacterium sp.]|nr:MFS transporter [Mycobacterium sp.]